MPKIELIQGDCLEVMKDISDKSIDMILTDIPYGVVNRVSNGLRNLDKGLADVLDFSLGEMVTKFCRVTKGSMYVFCGTEQVSDIRKQMVLNGLSTRLVIWNKTNPSPMNGQHIWLSSIECCVYGKFKNATFNEHCKGSVLNFPCGRGKVHPTEKPLKLFEYIVRVSSNENDTILDPFAGSGTTGVACKNLNRNFIGIELDPEYFKVAEKRINENRECKREVS
jgi:site-specific DNA-methyltransferase (adenine-specific)